MTAPDPRCCACGNAYGTRFLCAPCRADPANDGWREAPKREVRYERVPDNAPRMPWGEGEDPDVSPTLVRVARALLTMRGASLRAVARACGCSEAYVRKVATYVDSLRKP